MPFFSLLFAGHLQAALVSAGAGYTNDFSAQPAAADWATRSFGSSGTTGAGELTTLAALDAAVQTNAASMFTAPCGSASGAPPSSAAAAVWSSAGYYLQTRPSQCAATLILVTLVNNSGTNATAIHLNYDLTTNRASLVAEEVRGHRVFYSLSGLANTWSNIAALSQTTQGTLSVDLTLAGVWNHGSRLYLLWADDNGSGSPDDALDLDNFFTCVIAGDATPASCTLNSPTNGLALSAPASVTLTASAFPGPEAVISGVGFYEVTQGWLAAVTNSPFSTSVRLGVGAYNIYAIATNSLGQTTVSRTNLITVTNASLLVSLTAPANGLSVLETQPITATATVSGGEAPYTYAVTFFLVSTTGQTAVAASGTFPSFTAALGTLPEGSYRIYAETTDGAKTARSATNSFSTFGPIKVTAGGVTMTFDTNPPAVKWSTYSVSGTSTAQTLADMDNSMTAISATNIAAALGTQAGSGTSSTAYWRSGDQKLGTQPTSNRETLLMATLVNDTGLEVSQLDVAYTFGLASVTPGETNKGHRLYFNPTGFASNWNAIGFFSLSSTGAVRTNFTLTGLRWLAGEKLYLVWLDDNGSTNPDGDYTLDDFTFVATPAVLNVTVTSPMNGQAIVSGTDIIASARPVSGTAPYLVRFYTNSDANPSFAQAGTNLAASPYTMDLGTLPTGTYQIYASVTDQGGAGETVLSATNTFLVADPLTITLTAPTNSSRIDWTVPIGATGMVAGGTAPYTVRFYTNNVLAGVADGHGAEGYYKDLGAWFIGDYTVQATVTDGKGWQSTSAVNRLTITGPVFATLLPANSVSYNYGTSVTLTGLVVGGTAPYAGAFYLNGQMSGLVGPGLSPLVYSAGVLPVGSYTNHFVAIDDEGGMAGSGTNVISILPNLLTVNLTSPTNGQLVRPGAGMTATAAASVASPLNVSKVEFFLDGVSLGIDTNAPFSVSLAGAGDGSHTLSATATDSLGRQSASPAISIQVLNIPLGMVVGTDGYTNAFTTQPAATDWSTRAVGSSGMGTADMTNVVALDAAIQTNAASGVTAALGSSATSPPSSASTAVWCSAGYLQTRPTGDSFTLLLATLVNNADQHATSVRISYEFTTNRASLVAEDIRGQRVYYSLTGATNSWVNIPALSQTTQGVLTTEVALQGIWSNHTALYLLWADANGSGSPDDANDIDNFSVAIVGGIPLAASCTLAGPANGQSFGAPATVTLTAVASAGPDATLTGVGFYETTAGFLGCVLAAPFTNTVVLNAGTYSFYAVATNSLGMVITSLTNTITVTNVPFNVTLATPANGAAMGAPANVTLTANANAGTGASLTGVGFYDVSSGFLGSALAAPYTNTLTLGVGTYQLYAVATNSLGATLSSATNSLTVTNVPFSVTLTAPANGALYGSPASVVCQATAIAGSSGVPITSVSFYLVTNGNATLFATDADAPYSASVSNLSDGSYGFFAVAVNSQNVTVVSATNLVSVASTFTRGPYLGSRSATGITIRWRTAESMVGRVRYGTDPANLAAFADDISNRTDHVVTLANLLPETRYFYAVGSRASTNYYFVTAPPNGASRSTRIWFLSDYGVNDSTQTAVRDTYMNYVATNGRAADVWLTGGDNEQSGFVGADSAYQTSMFNVYSNLLQNNPIFPCPGNHDGGAASAYWSIFDLPYQGQAGGVPSGSQHYYSFNYGNVHFISLDAFNTSTDVGSPMLTWLTNDLVANTQAWTIAYWHAPVYCKVFYDSDSVSQLVAMRQNFAPLLESYGVDLVLNGHSHTLQRTYLLNQHYGVSSTFSPTNKVDGGDGHEDGVGAYLKPGRLGTVYAVAPTGCGMTRTSSSTHPACVVTVQSTAGYLMIDINSNRLDFKMITSAGDVGDYFTILKGASQLAAPAVPAGLAASANGSAATLAWSNNATNEAGYLLERSINGAPFTPLARIGANLTTFTNTSMGFSNAYYYRLRSWNNAGYSDFSAMVNLTPSGALAIDQQPQSVVGLPGSAVIFKVLARGTAPITYQWYKEGTLLDGQTNSTLRLSNLSSNQAGYYGVVVANGGTPLTSNPALLTVTSNVTAPRVVAWPRMQAGVFGGWFQGAVSGTYIIEYKDSLNAPTWLFQTNVVAPSDGLFQLQDITGGAPQRFYRFTTP